MDDLCEECDHWMSNHIGVVDMGGGHSEAVGCCESDENGSQCMCLNYEKD